MSSLWVIHFMEYIKTQLEAQGQDQYNNILSNIEALMMHFQLDRNHRQ